MSKLHRLLLFFLLLTLGGMAQTHADIPPVSFGYSSILFASPIEVFLPVSESDVLQWEQRAIKKGQLATYAENIPHAVDMLQQGSWTTLLNGDRICRLTIHSNGAKGLILYYDAFSLLAGCMLHTYTPDRRYINGAFLSESHTPSGSFCTGLLPGDETIIEYYQPKSIKGNSVIHLSEIGYAYRMVPQFKVSRDFSDSDPCEVNVNCSEGAAWANQRDAVVRLSVKTGSATGWCSGVMVNNTALDCAPYILSADHCYQDEFTGALPSISDLHQWVFYYGYQSSGCATPASEGTLGNTFMTGCNIVAASLDTGGSSGSDFSLLRLLAVPPSAFNAYYAGWSSADSTPQSGVGIHHPSGDIKKISTFTKSAMSISYGNIVHDTHWLIHWAATANGHGVTEAGSSGSPIFNAQHRIVGTLTGGNSFCIATDSPDYFGKMSYHWSRNGTTATRRLSDWLDPLGTGLSYLDGIAAPCTPIYHTDAALHLPSPQGTICSTAPTLSVTLTNAGSDPLHTVDITYTVDGNATVVHWSGVLTAHQSTTVSLPPQVLATGSHSLMVKATNPNATIDSDTTNNSVHSNFQTTSTSNTLTLTLTTDDYGSQTYWELTNGRSQIVYHGGPYTDTLGGKTIIVPMCLPDGCYTFTLFDKGGDGLVGSTVNGSYKITDAHGGIKAQSSTPAFGSSDSRNLCTYPTGIAEPSVPTLTLTLYPNPASHTLYITATYSTNSDYQLAIYDCLGQLVLNQPLSFTQSRVRVSLSDLSTGLYMVRVTNNGVSQYSGKLMIEK